MPDDRPRSLWDALPHVTGSAARCAARFSLLALCLLLSGAGLLHFAVPAPYRRIIPAPLRTHAPAVVAASGLCELVCAALLAVPRTRRFGAYATAALFVAVFPANVQMALDSIHRAAPLSPGLVAAAWLRLPLQAPLILWALRFRHTPEGRGANA